MAFFQTEMFLAIIPELGLLVLAGLLLTLSLLKNQRINSWMGRVTAIGSALVAVLAFIFSMPGAEPTFLWGGMLRLDMAGFLFRILFLVGVSLTAIFAENEEVIRTRPEFYAMLVFSAIGMSFMASAGDLIMLFLAIEIASIPLYVLAGVKFRNEKSVEAGIKYFLFGSLASAIMVFGFSILYGMGGTTQINQIHAAVLAANVPLAGLVGAVLLILAGFTFKISAVPFHWWAPDVYEGAPTPVSGFLSTASKAAGFAIMVRLMSILFGAEHAVIWQILIAVIAIASMFGGNLVAIQQKNFKRLLAYSSIAQAGYILIGVAAGTEFGYTAVVYYLMVYLLTNLMLVCARWLGGKNHRQCRPYLLCRAAKAQSHHRVCHPHRITFIGRNPAVWRILCQAAGLWGSNGCPPGMAGNHRYPQFSDQPLLLPANSKANVR